MPRRPSWQRLVDASNAKVDVVAYEKLPAGTSNVNQAWSGDLVLATSYLPEGTDSSVLGYWKPAPQETVVGTDISAILKDAEHPVLAHLFLDMLMDTDNALTNFAFTGYQGVITGLESENVLAAGIIPENLTNTLVGDDDFAEGIFILALPRDTEVKLEDSVESRQRRRVSRKPSRAELGWLWGGFTLPGTVWLAAFFFIPFYAVAGVAFGTTDPIFLTAQPEWNPLQWDFTAFSDTLSRVLTGDLQAPFQRTIIYVLVAVALCFLIGYPVAYYLARYAGRTRTLLLALLVLPFWVSYLMRMLAWVNLLSPDGWVNRFLEAVPIFGGPRAWLDANPVTVVLGLVYGYIPFVILPLYATLDRIDKRLLEAARDAGATPAPRSSG